MSDPEKPNVEKPNVTVPPPTFRTGQLEAALWDSIGQQIDTARNQLGDDMAFSVILSRVARELRRKGGIAMARDVFLGMVETMEEAAKNDR